MAFVLTLPFPTLTVGRGAEEVADAGHRQAHRLLQAGHDREGCGQAPLLLVCTLQIPQGRVTIPGQGAWRALEVIH